MRIAARALAFTALFLAAPLPAAAATLNSFAVSGPSATSGDVIGVDSAFTAQCGGSDGFGCEYTVAEGRVGNRTTTGATELIIFNRLSGVGAITGSSGQTGLALSSAVPTLSTFTIQYDATAKSIGLSLFNRTISYAVDLGRVPANAVNNPTELAQSLVLRVRNASLSNLALTSSLGANRAVSDGAARNFAEVDQLNRSLVGYLYLGGFNLAQNWSLTGTAAFSQTGTGSGSAFQAKVTTLEVTPVPVPAALALLLAALGALGGRHLLRR